MTVGQKQPRNRYSNRHLLKLEKISEFCVESMSDEREASMVSQSYGNSGLGIDIQAGIGNSRCVFSYLQAMLYYSICFLMQQAESIILTLPIVVFPL